MFLSTPTLPAEEEEAAAAAEAEAALKFDTCPSLVCEI